MAPTASARQDRARSSSCVTLGVCFWDRKKEGGRIVPPSSRSLNLQGQVLIRRDPRPAVMQLLRGSTERARYDAPNFTSCDRTGIELAG